MKQSSISYFSLFSGIGGFELGIEQVMPYAKCVGYSEINPYALSIYKKHFKEHKNYGDATKINYRTVPSFDLLVGGSPCQDLSLAGKRYGLNGNRSGLFKEYIRAIKEKQPSYFIWENVKGTLSSNRGWDFAEIIYQMEQAGYDVQWQILNSKNHRVPQHRERIIIIGHLRGQGREQILPISTNSEQTVESIVQLNKTNLRSNGGTQTYCGDRVYDAKGVSPAIKQSHVPKIICYNSQNSRLSTRDKDINKKGVDRDVLSRDDGLSYTITAKQHHMVQIVAGDEASRIYSANGVSKTIKNGGGGGVKTGLYAIPIKKENRYGSAIYNNQLVTIRYLAPKECERLQGFPDDWTKIGADGTTISDTQRYKCLGNAVTTNVVASIISALKPIILDKKTNKKLLLPRVVKFSGGRSSAMMLLQLLEKGKLKQWRGDCVVFCNTSAEHKATYNFIRKIKQITEQNYKLPFFIIEYQTYEVKNSRNKYVRRNSYRLVNEYPYDATNNPFGYKCKGEVFKEYLSHTGSLPNQFQRTCTVNLKIITNNIFLADYWSGKSNIDVFGHGFRSQLSDIDAVNNHRKNKGELADADIIIKKKFLQECSTIRHEQFFKDYTTVNICLNNEYLQDYIKKNGTIKLLGKKSIMFISYLGIRYDEKHRADRIRARIVEVKNNLVRKKKKQSIVRTQPTYETVKTPLISTKVISSQVINFWKKRPEIDLVLPYNGLYSNCVFCFLKGKTKRRLLAHTLQNQSIDDGPSSIDWWVDIESKFSRKVIKSNNNYTHIGFFGVAEQYEYQNIAEDTKTHKKTLQELIADVQKYNNDWTMACSCTD